MENNGDGNSTGATAVTAGGNGRNGNSNSSAEMAEARKRVRLGCSGGGGGRIGKPVIVMICMSLTQVLAHKSIGCFVNHCGYGSMWEALMSDSQLVFVPNIIDQILNTRLMADELGVAVEVEKGENGWISKENLCRAVRSVMDEDSQIGCLVRENHRKWRQVLFCPLISKGESWVDFEGQSMNRFGINGLGWIILDSEKYIFVH
ncbi:UDP-glycosyltransferase 79B3-like [Ipomoea triloba]|uniref:UDP-glycosyltransferase 79B3-like n=1 Tax=Ipomoea triloba TaxID=35885 RepID=UPI00125DDF54|nr:UDP-glycosyltransferase 79B3-like [Ipomoea triloba]